MRRFLISLMVCGWFVSFAQAQKLLNGTLGAWGINHDALTVTIGEPMINSVMPPQSGVECLRSGFIEAFLAVSEKNPVPEPVPEPEPVLEPEPVPEPEPEPEPEPVPEPEPEPEPEEPLGIEQVQSVLNIQVQEKRLEIQGDKAYRLEIYTITGRLMEGRQKSEYHSVILPNGIYFVILRSDNETKDYKIYVP